MTALTMILTGADLIRFNSTLARGTAAIYADSLNKARESANVAIDTPRRLRHFIAQLAHESNGFRGLTESLRYTAQGLLKTFSSVQTLAHAQSLVAQGEIAIGNFIYANKLGNGPAASGDGYRYRGRGFIMNTGRANYAAIKRYAPALDVVANPDLLGRPDEAAMAAAQYWMDRKINVAADEDDLQSVTRLVNGHLQGLQNRQAMLTIAEGIWPG